MPMHLNIRRIFSVAVLLATVGLALPMAGGQSETRSLPAVKTRAEFDSLAVVYDPDTAYALPHVMFVIDRQNKNRIYYVNSKRYKFHKDFVNGTYLSLERGQIFFENNYIKPNRRFILGTVAYHTPVRKWTFEYWEGDQIPTEQIKLTSDIINRTFFTPVAYKPNSLRQEQASANIPGLARVLQSEILRGQDYQALNVAKGLGRIHVIAKLDDHVEIGSNEILVLDEVPIHLPPVAGIITSKPSTPLSHINLLAKGWGVPNAYIKNAHELFKQYDGWWVEFDARRDTYSIKRADNTALNEYLQRLKQRRDIMTPRFDLSVTRLATLNEQRRTSSVAYGAKSANLGELIRARVPGFSVPPGFTVPFSYYDEFMKENELDLEIIRLLNDDNKFIHDPAYRRIALTKLREQIQKGTFDGKLRDAILRQWRTQLGGRGVFARSSTNSEDLPNFSGAGLYSSVPNVRTDDQLIDAIKAVWASVWNFQAYEARERAGIDHTKVFMAVLIQEGINSESSGVMITADPFNADGKEAIYISAKRGLGIKVVEGQKVAEQVVFRPRANAVQVLTRSEEDSLLTFDENGGVKEIPISGERAVLSDAVVRRLARAGQSIKRVFGNRDQDIEWAYMRGQIYIVQARPFIAGG